MNSQILTFSIVASLLLARSLSASATSPALASLEECNARFQKVFDDGRNLKLTRESVQTMQNLGMLLPTEAKAVLINADKNKAGFIVEVGTAQEVASYIDKAGERSNTILNSATYNGKKVSDDRYKPSKTGYVSKERLTSILDIEQAELERLYLKDGDSDFPAHATKFFVFGDTTSTRPNGDGHAWVGLRFQIEPMGPWHTVKMHVRLLDLAVPKQSKALGVLGTNLIYAAFHQTNSIEAFMAGLKENMTLEDHGGLEIDSMHFEGPNFSQWTDNYVAVSLLKAGLTETVSMTADGQFVPASQQFYNKAVLLYELTSNLSNTLNKDSWSRAVNTFSAASQVLPDNIRGVNWISLSQLSGASGVNGANALNLIHSFKGASQPLLITKFGSKDSLSEWNRIFHVKSIGIMQNSSQQVQISNTKEKTVSPDEAHLIRYLN